VGTKNVFALLTHLDKKHELLDVCCKDFIGYFRHGLYPGRIDIVLKTGDRVTLNRLRQAKGSCCLGCDYFRNRHHNIEIHPKVHKEIYATMQALG
jgi:hypothetical protein